MAAGRLNGCQMFPNVANYRIERVRRPIHEKCMTMTVIHCIGAENTDKHRCKGWGKGKGLNFCRAEWFPPIPENDPAMPILMEAVTVPKLPCIRELVWRPWQ